MRRSARRLTYRARLTLAFGAVAFASSSLVIALVALFMTYVPRYEIAGFMLSDDSLPELPVDDPAASYSFVINSANDIPNVILQGGAIVLVLVTAAAAWSGWIISGRLLRPLSRINEAARRAGEGDLTHRIRLDGPHDEIRNLAETFDYTLDRLQRTFEAHTRFTANAAHELRTPLTATKALLDITAAHPNAMTSTEILDDIRHNNDRSIELVQALLTLTTLEATTAVLAQVDVAQLARESLERAANSLDNMEITVQLEPAPTLAERPLVALVLDNLIQNAQRHDDARSYLVVRSGTDGTGSWVEVENTGDVIRATDLAKLTEPLFRIRRVVADGHGLGLAIVRSVLDRHNAELRIAPRLGGGLIVTATFPPHHPQTPENPQND